MKSLIFYWYSYGDHEMGLFHWAQSLTVHLRLVNHIELNKYRWYTTGVSECLSDTSEQCRACAPFSTFSKNSRASVREEMFVFSKYTKHFVNILLWDQDIIWKNYPYVSRTGLKDLTFCQIPLSGKFESQNNCISVFHNTKILSD